MNNLTIGIVEMIYNEEGNITHATFTPTMNITLDDSLKSQLQTINGAYESEAIQQNANMVFAGWFSKINEIELADRNEWEIASEVVHCEKYPNGKVNICQLKFIFRKR